MLIENLDRKITASKFFNLHFARFYKECEPMKEGRKEHEIDRLPMMFISTRSSIFTLPSAKECELVKYMG